MPPVDPMAALARLRQPTGSWLHLLAGAPADARQLGWMLSQDDVVVRFLRGHCLHSAYGLFDEAAAALQLPGDPIEDWPSFTALLTELPWLPGAGHVLVVTRAALLLAAASLTEIAGFVRSGQDVVQGRAEEGDPVPFHVILQDDTIGLATLRPRLDAVQAQYDTLTDWAAQEPVAEPVAGSRVRFGAGAVTPDDVDRAVTRAVAGGGLIELRRSWLELRGPASDPIRVYSPVLARTAGRAGVRAIDGSDWSVAGPEAAVAAVVSAAVAGLGGSCLVLPLPDDPSRYDAQQRAVAGVAVAVWPVPESSPQPAQPPALHVAVPRPDAADAARRQAPMPEPGPVPVAGPAPAPARALVDGPVAAPAPARALVDGPVAAPADHPGGPFELVAANLEWNFIAGSAEPDLVDAALIQHAASSSSSRIVALFRSWVHDPDGSWVRVVLAYLTPGGSLVQLDEARSAALDALEEAGAVRCCVEIVPLSGVTEVHRWLEERCTALWQRAVPALAPAAPAASAAPAAPGLRAAPDVQAAPVRVDRSGPGVDRSGPGVERPGPAVEAGFRPGPAPGDPAMAEVAGALTAWAEQQPRVLALLTGWRPGPAGDVLALGIVVDGDADAAVVGSAATAAVRSTGQAAHVEVWTPSRGLDPEALRRYRTSTRFWTRTNRAGSGRATTAHPGPGPVGAVAAAPQVVAPPAQPPRPVDTNTPVEDVVLPGGFTLAGIDLDSPLEPGPTEPDDRDTAVVAWARDQPAAVALLRGTSVAADRAKTRFPVYCLVATLDASATSAADPGGPGTGPGTDPDEEQLRRALAAAIAATGASRAAAEVFSPSGAISAFHIGVGNNTRVLWRRPPGLA